MLDDILCKTKKYSLFIDISKYDEAIQKAINNFETEVEKIKIHKMQKENNLKETLKAINNDLLLLKSAVQNG